MSVCHSREDRILLSVTIFLTSLGEEGWHKEDESGKEMARPRATLGKESEEMMTDFMGGTQKVMTKIT